MAFSTLYRNYLITKNMEELASSSMAMIGGGGIFTRKGSADLGNALGGAIATFIALLLFGRVDDIPNLSTKTRAPRNHSSERHHIVARTSLKAAAAQSVLKTLGIDINSEENLVSLSYGFHRILHTNVYYAFVNYMIVGAYIASDDPKQQKTNVIDTLKLIKGWLKYLDPNPVS